MAGSSEDKYVEMTCIRFKCSENIRLNQILVKISLLLGKNIDLSMGMRNDYISIRMNTSDQSRVAFHFKVGTVCGRLSTFCT